MKRWLLALVLSGCAASTPTYRVYAPQLSPEQLVDFHAKAGVLALGVEDGTRNWDDISTGAIKEPNFFCVQAGPDGPTRYARTLKLSRKPDSSGYLMDARGYLTSPPLAITDDTTDWSVRQDGSLHVKRTGQTETEELGIILVARFPNPNGLLDEGNGYFAATAASGPPALGRPTFEGLGPLKVLAE